MMTNTCEKICEGCVLVGPLFSEPMRVETAREGSDGAWKMAIGLESLLTT